MRLPAFLKPIFSLLLLSTIFVSITAQTTGQNEPGIDWKIMITPKVDIIYANGQKDKASRVANIINHIAENHTASIGDKFRRKIPLVLRNRTVEPNGYVGLAPHRSELFTTPPSNLNVFGSNDWLDALTIHEYRHVLQLYNGRRGLASLLYYLQGQVGWGAFNLLSIPNWFYEGDAVVTETAMSNSGRGRTPYFMAIPRAMAIDNKDYSYNKWRNGSFDDLMPNHYRLGYMMLTHMRNHFGNGVNAEVLAEGAKFYNIYPFSNALKSKTGLSTKGLFNASWNEYKEICQSRLDNIVTIPTTRLSTESGTVTNYSYPQYTDEEDLIALKSSYKKTPHIVRLNNSEEKEIRNIGISLSNYINESDNKVVWTEFVQNARRNNTNYNNIYLYDIKTGDTRRITKKGKYFSPALSSDGTQIVASKIDENGNSSLHIWNINRRSIKSAFKLQKDAFAYNPVFTTDDKYIVYIEQYHGQLTLKKIEIERKILTSLSPTSTHVITAPRVHGEYIYYSASYSQIDNIYRVSLDGSQTVEQISSVPIGAYEPAISPDGKTLAMTELTSNGKIITTMPIQIRNTKAISIIEPINQQWLDKTAAEFEGGDILTDAIPTKKYEVKDYKRLLKGMRLHSWNFVNPDNEPSLNLQWNNVLDDVAINLSGGYNVNEKQEFYTGNIKIAKYFPVFDLQASRRGRNTDYLTTSGIIAEQTFAETSFGGTVSIPLSVVKGNFLSNFNIGVGTDLRILKNREVDGIKVIPFENDNTTTSNVFISYGKKRRTALQNVRTRLGLSFEANYYRDLNESADEKIYGFGNIYLPGLATNHSLRVTGTYQKELLTNVFQQSDAFRYSRGYSAPINDEAYRFSADYGFPLLYPDFGIEGILYFKRVRMNLFYDYGETRRIDNNTSLTLSSTGAELIFDNVMFNLLPFSIGLRYAHRLDDLGNQKKGGDFMIVIETEF
ncbi:MAG: hypothetical protein ACJATI_002002 [Halioglobus sp.]|jgi:hypothetical protein